MATFEGEIRGRDASSGKKLLRRSGLAWFLVAAAGLAAFVWMIVAHYGRKTMSGNLAGWNDKPIIKGYVPGDTPGNAMFAVHVLLAAIVTIGGLLQLVPAIRRRAPWFHRWNGRLFFIIAYIMALGGLWLGLLGIAMATGLAIVLRRGVELPEQYWKTVFDAYPVNDPGR